MTPTGTTVERLPDRPGPPVSLQKGDPFGVGNPAVSTYPTQATAPFGPPPSGPPTFGPPPSGPPPPGPAPYGSPQGPRRSAGRTWAIAALVAVLVAAVAVVTVVLVRTRSSDQDPTTAASSGQVLPPTAAGSAQPTADPPPRQSKASVSQAAGTGSGSTASSGPATTVTAVEPSRQDIGCDQGYIVQVASELDRAAFDRRIAEIRAAGQLPAGVRWADTATSCDIFTTQTNVLVLYAGPFASAAEACPARLLSPPDALIKGTTSGTTTVTQCLCPADPATLPAITSVGQRDVWVGELQQVLGGKLDYDIGEINADPASGDPGRWGVFTGETADAVGRFQVDSNLPETRQVDSATWSALRSQGC